MINGIKPKVSESDFNVAVNRLVYNIDKDYMGWKSRSKYDDMPGAFPDVDITIKTGRKFIKIIWSSPTEIILIVIKYISTSMFGWCIPTSSFQYITSFYR